MFSGGREKPANEMSKMLWYVCVSRFGPKSTTQRPERLSKKFYLWSETDKSPDRQGR